MDDPVFQDQANTNAYDPSNALADALAFMPPEAGEHPGVWDLLHYLVRAHPPANPSAQVPTTRQQSLLSRMKSCSMLSAVARMKTTRQTRPRQVELLEHILRSGADPWVDGAGNAVLVLMVAPSTMTHVITHSSFPGWRTMASERGFETMMRAIDAPCLVRMLDLGMPVKLSARTPTTGFGSLLDVCNHHEAINELVRRGAPVGEAFIKRMETGSVRPTPAIMEMILRTQPTAQGQRMAAALLARGLEDGHAGNTQVGAVLCAPATTLQVVAASDKSSSRISGLKAIAKAARRGAITLDDSHLLSVCALIHGLGDLAAPGLEKLRGSSSMAWLGEQIAGLATRLVQGRASAPPACIPALAAVVSGLVPTPFAPAWCRQMPAIERAESLLVLLEENPCEVMDHAQMVRWQQCIESSGAIAPPSFFRTLRNEPPLMAKDRVKWLPMIVLASFHCKAGGRLTNEDFVIDLERVHDRLASSGWFKPDSMGVVASHIRSIRAKFDHDAMLASTPSPLARPAPRM